MLTRTHAHAHTQGCKFLVIYSGNHTKGMGAMDALERDLKEHGLPQVAVMNGAQTQPTPGTQSCYSTSSTTTRDLVCWC